MSTATVAPRSPPFASSSESRNDRPHQTPPLPGSAIPADVGGDAVVPMIRPLGTWPPAAAQPPCTDDDARIGRGPPAAYDTTAGARPVPAGSVLVLSPAGRATSGAASRPQWCRSCNVTRSTATFAAAALNWRTACVEPDLHLVTLLVELNKLLPDATWATARQVRSSTRSRRLASRTKQARSWRCNAVAGRWVSRHRLGAHDSRQPAPLPSRSTHGSFP